MLDGTVERITELARILAAIVVDTVFLAAVVGMSWLLHSVLLPQFEPEGSARVGFIVLDWAFMVCTVGIVLAYLAIDTWVAVARLWGENVGNPSQASP